MQIKNWMWLVLISVTAVLLEDHRTISSFIEIPERAFSKAPTNTRDNLPMFVEAQKELLGLLAVGLVPELGRNLVPKG